MADQEREMAAMAEASKQTYINQQQVKSDLDMFLFDRTGPVTSYRQMENNIGPRLALQESGSTCLVNVSVG